MKEYLALENASLEKHEYYQGEIFLMAGGKITHNTMVVNVKQYILKNSAYYR